MANLNQILELARQLSAGEREQLLRALRAPARAELPLMGAPPPQSADWVRAERGHAVLDTGAPAAAGGPVPPGAAAIAGIWADLPSEVASGGEGIPAAGYAGPALVATDVCVELARGSEAARGLFTAGRIEVRLSTATYLELLAAARDREERHRVQAFASAYPVLSLGPMASGRSVELLLAHRDAGLGPLAALAAATALAHEIPLVTVRPGPFLGIDGLLVLSPY